MVEDNYDTERAYRQLCETLKNDGWTEMREGESYMNGVTGNNFMRDDKVITILYNENMDEEELDDLFGSEDDMAPSVVAITPAKFCDDDGDCINEPEDD